MITCKLDMEIVLRLQKGIWIRDCIDNSRSAMCRRDVTGAGPSSTAERVRMVALSVTENTVLI